MVSLLEKFVGENLGYVAVLNGVLGDLLEEKKSPLSIQMAFYENNQPMALDKEKWSQGVGGKICILAHGSCNTENDWRFKDDPSRDYGSLLKKDSGYTPFYLRYNSGLHIFVNGQRLSNLLEELIGCSSQEISEIVLIGHSMGGLVFRSACHYGMSENRNWVRLVKKIFYLGTPHLGTHFERFGNLTTTFLHRIPTLPTRAIASFLDLRSAGIKDMRHGSLTPLLTTAEHYSLCSILSKSMSPTFRHWFGDGMVHPESSMGQSLLKISSLPANKYHVKIIPGIYHYNLPRDIKIYKQIKKACCDKLWVNPGYFSEKSNLAAN